MVQAGDMCFEVEVAGDQSSDKLALLLHGFPECAYSWRHQITLLAGMVYKVWAPNQRGYGNTTRPLGIGHYRLNQLVDDVCALIDASGCTSTTLIGHDWGAAVAWMVAIGQVRPLDRLIVMNVPHPTLFVRHVRRWRQLKRSWYILFFQLPWLPELLLRRNGATAVGEAFRGMAIDKSMFPDEVLDVYRRQALEPGALTAMINWYRALRYGARRQLRELDAPPTVETPTLMIWGEHDTALGKELTYGTDELVSDLTVHYLPDVSHWVQQEAPEVVNKILESWLLGASEAAQTA